MRMTLLNKYNTMKSANFILNRFNMINWMSKWKHVVMHVMYVVFFAFSLNKQRMLSSFFPAEMTFRDWLVTHDEHTLSRNTHLNTILGRQCDKANPSIKFYSLLCLTVKNSPEWTECVLTCPALAAGSMRSSGCLCVWPLVAPDCHAASAVWCGFKKHVRVIVTFNHLPQITPQKTTMKINCYLSVCDKLYRMIKCLTYLNIVF